MSAFILFLGAIFFIILGIFLLKVSLILFRSSKGPTKTIYTLETDKEGHLVPKDKTVPSDVNIKETHDKIIKNVRAVLSIYMIIWTSVLGFFLGGAIVFLFLNL